MSNPGHTRPAALRPGYTKLPDGRGRMVTMLKLSAGEQLRDDLLLDWGTLYTTAERTTGTGRNTKLADLRLVGGQEMEQIREGGWVWVRIYEEVPATAEVQAGKLRKSTDADGRQVGQAEFLQFSSATATPGTIGTTAAPGVSTLILMEEVAVDDGALRRITRRYAQVPAAAATAEAVGPIVISYPFNHLGDITHVIASQEFEQLTSYYAPLATTATLSTLVANATQTLYYIGDEITSRQGATLVRFKRSYANLPADRDEYETYAATFPGVGASNAEWAAELKVKIRNGFTRTVTSKVSYAFYRIGAVQDIPAHVYTSPTSIPLVTVQTYKKTGALATDLSPTQVWVSDVSSLSFAYGGFTNLLTVPTRTDYFAIPAYGIIVSCELRRYKGLFYVRITRGVSPI